MSLRRKIIYISFLLILWSLCFGVYYLLFTPKGSQFLVRKVLEHYTLDRQVQFDAVEGDLINGITFNNVVLMDLDELPLESELRIQDLSVKVNSFQINGIFAHLNNARLRLPISEPVILNAELDNGRLQGTIFSPALDVSEVVGYLPKNKHTRDLEGLIKGLDLHIDGTRSQPSVSGTFLLDSMDNGQFEAEAIPVVIDLQYKDRLVTPQLFGEIELSSGNVMSKRTVINLRKSHLFFSGNPENPRLDINGFTRISKTDITLGIKGQLKDPKILLSSEPPLPKELLLLMVATGKKWSGLTESIDSGEISPALAKDFVQYLFFGGRGNFIADKFGLSDFSVSVSDKSQGVGAAKQITDNLEVKYEVERQSGDATTTSSTTQTVGSELRVTNRVTLDLKKEFKTSDDTEGSGAAEIMLKFKTSF